MPWSARCASSAGSTSDGASSRRLGSARSAASTTASFWSGSIAHVEYTRRPPGRSSAQPRSRMASCVGCARRPARTLHRSHLAGDLRSVPSPPHGTSQRIRSKRSGGGSGGGCGGSLLWLREGGASRLRRSKLLASPTVAKIGTQADAIESARRTVRSCRCQPLSFETSRPFARAAEGWGARQRDASIMSNSCSVLPPGAAQRSQTASPCDGCSMRAGIIAAASCSASSPLACPRSKRRVMAALAAALESWLQEHHPSSHSQGSPHRRRGAHRQRMGRGRVATPSPSC